MIFNRFNVTYPILYALESDNKDAKLFNCVQVLVFPNFIRSNFPTDSTNNEFVCCAYMRRGHQHSLEMMPMFFTLMMLGGMRHPCTCAALGLLYTVSRIFYFKGYATGDPQKRLTVGKYGFLALLGLSISTVSFGVSLLL